MIKTFRLSSKGYQAEVVIGKDVWGGDISVLVTGKRDSVIAEALKSLSNLLDSSAEKLVDSAFIEARARTLVSERVKNEVEQEKARLKANATHELESLNEIKVRHQAELNEALLANAKLRSTIIDLTKENREFRDNERLYGQ
jgi:cell division septum initiation protein DivIVA